MKRATQHWTGLKLHVNKPYGKCLTQTLYPYMYMTAGWL